MELLEGQTLKQRIAGRSLPTELLLELAYSTVPRTAPWLVGGSWALTVGSS